MTPIECAHLHHWDGHRMCSLPQYDLRACYERPDTCPRLARIAEAEAAAAAKRAPDAEQLRRAEQGLENAT